VSAQIQLKPTSINEAEALFPLFNEIQNVRYTNFQKFDTTEKLQEFLIRFLMINQDEPIQYGPYSIYLNDNLLGMCGLQQINLEAGISEIWYILNKDHWGKGIAKEVTSILFKMTKSNEKLKYIYAEAVGVNIASWKILEHLGFIKTGELKNGFNKGEIKEDLWMYSYDCTWKI
jgi:RimJ/RimL family protein N-acetyltransferase